MNVLKKEKQLQVLSALVEGNSIRSTSRMFDVHRDTVCRLLIRVGAGCERLMDQQFRNLKCESIQVDEIWCFVKKKHQKLTPCELKKHPELGTQYVFVAIDPETKLVPAYMVGKRGLNTVVPFFDLLRNRIEERFTLVTDGYQVFREGVDWVFHGKLDYAVVKKVYGKGSVHIIDEEKRYSPPRFRTLYKKAVYGKPDLTNLSTSHIERQNLTMRMCMRRFTRLTNGFSKTVEGLRAAVALHFAYYNFCRIHQTIRTTPAMEAGVTSRIWEVQDLLEMDGYR
jgi:IS1 family transposase